MTYAELLRKIDERKARGAWNIGVKDYAHMIVEQYVDSFEVDLDSPVTFSEKDALNGAENWDEYARGGSGLVYDEAICKALCSPTTQKRFAYGAKAPSDEDDWIDVEARALYQSWELIKTILRE